MLALGAIFMSSFGAEALTILSGPTLTTSATAPLAAALQLTTDDYSRVSVSVDNGQQTWQRDFYDYDTEHLVPVLGFKPDQTNVITVTVHDRLGNKLPATQPILFVTGPKPPSFPPSVLLTSQPDRMEPGYTLLMIFNQNSGQKWASIVDQAGDLVWYNGPGITTSFDVRQMENGDLFIPMATNFVEVSLLGQIVYSWGAPPGLSIDFHDGLPTDHGTILYLNNASRVVTNFPSSATISNSAPRTAAVQYNRVIEISATNSALLNTWSIIDMLDPYRITYLTFSARTALGWDSEHGNALIEDPRDNSIIVSLRHQDAVIKFSRDTGQLKWILGPHENWNPPWQPYLFSPTGDPFLWNYAQHAPMLTPHGTLLLYDNGNNRASPFDARLPDVQNFSRAVEYDLNQDTMEISQVWEFGRENAERLYTDRVGNAEWLPRRGNVLVTSGYTIFDNGVRPSTLAPNAVMTRVREVTHDADPQVVFDLSFFDYSNQAPNYRGVGSYRSHRIPDLYPVVSAARAVADLAASVASSGSRRQRGLIASLSGAIKSIGQDKLNDAVFQLRTFQFLTRVAQVPPETAVQFFNDSQSIIDALSSGKSAYATERLTGQFPHYSPNHALADLIGTVGESGARTKGALLTFLTAAFVSINESDTDDALRELRLFQSMVKSARLSPGLTTQLNDQAQRVIDVIRQSPYVGRLRLQADGANGKLHLKFDGSRNRTYAVLASSDLVNWVQIGLAVPAANGRYEFEQPYSSESPYRYFRVVSL